MPEQTPTPVRRQLALELRTARTLAGVSQDEMARQLGRSQSLMARVERAERLLTRDDTATWLDVARADDDVRIRVLALTEGAHAERSRWETAFGGQAHLQTEIRDEDRLAAVVNNFQPTVLPGYLQTIDYAREAIRVADGQHYTVEGVDQQAALAARIERQSLLYETGRTFRFIVAEGLLYREPAPGLLAPQLAHMLRMTELEAVDLAVLPASYMGALPWHNFLIRHPADGSPPKVNMELLHGPCPIDREKDVAIYLELWDRLWEASARGDAALSLIREAS